jgi:hypothetical protein
VVVGPHWVHPIETIIFAKDGSAWGWWKNPGRDFGKVRNFGDEIVDVEGDLGQFILSDTKNKITRQTPNYSREFQRQVVPPSRNIAGVVWVLDDNKSRNVIFHADGKFTHNGPWPGKGTWLNLGGGFYGVNITEGNKIISLYKLNSNFTQLEHRWSGNGTENWTRTTSLPPEITAVSPTKSNVSNAAPVVIKHTLANTKWRFGNTDAYVIAFSADGSYTQKTGAKTSSGKWLVTDPTAIRTSTGNATFALSPDRRTITQTANGKSYTWNYAGALKPAATTQSVQAAPNTASPAASSVALQTRTPAEEFVILRESEEKVIAEEMRNINRRDKGSLESLEKRVGISNIKLQEKITNALRAVKNSESFEADEPRKNHKLSPHENDFLRIKQDRDKKTEEARRNVTNRLKSSYQSVLRRATAAKDFETAKSIEEHLASAGPFGPFVGTWQEHGGSLIKIDSKGQANVSWKGGKEPSRRVGERNIALGGWKLRLSNDGKALIEVNVNPGKRWRKQDR